MTFRYALTLALTLTAAIACAAPEPGAPLDAEDLAGRILAEGPDGPVELPLLEAQYTVDIQGTLATVQVSQTFLNPSVQPMRAEYLFPLNQGAAIYGMDMTIGDQITRAQIQRKAEAEATFEQAASEGKTASLLTQHRPNMFTQQIANLMPGQPVEVTLRYTQRVPRIDGAYELVIPMVVGPRYDARPQGDPLELAAAELAPTGAWAVSDLPAYPGVAGLDLPQTVAGDRVGLDLSLAFGGAPASIDSATHALEIETTQQRLVARLSQGKTQDNRDFVLRYRLGEDQTSARALGHYDSRGGFVSLRIEPPQVEDATLATPRELVFVLDTSGSMGGAPMLASKVFMSAAIDALRPSDHFRIIRFADGARHFASGPMRASLVNKARAQAHVKTLMAGGGTQIDRAIRDAFATAPVEDALRIVVFLSDGYIGDEARVLQTIRSQIGAARIYAFGVGSSVNRYLLDEMAKEGRGYARYIAPDEDGGQAARALAADLKTPLLTDITVDWGGLEVAQQSPARIPDLFAGKGVEVLARYSGDAAQIPTEITVAGRVQGQPASLKITPVLPGPGAASTAEAIALIWARTRIADLEAAMLDPGANRQGLEQEITRLGLDFALQSRFTSFVAVAEEVANQSRAPELHRAVALPMPQGVPATAYPKTKFTGSSAPEPQTILGLLLAASLGLLRLLRLFRRTGPYHA